MLSEAPENLTGMEQSPALAVVIPLLLFLAGAAAGLAVGWLLASRRAEPAAQEQEIAALRQENTELERRLATAAESSRLQTERVEALEERAAQDQDVLTALAPLADRLRGVQEHVTRMEKDRSQQFGEVTRALEQARDSDAELQRVTGSLAGSLRSNSARGTWGEIQLRRVVEAAGMLRHVDFDEQVHVRTEDGAHRPDMVVRLPGEQRLIVDSKAPMASYLKAQDLQDDGSDQVRAARAELRTAHADALRTHVDQLASKKYWTSAVGSPELVLCFVPVESALSAALETDPSLLDHAASRNVALVSPVSLLASLKAVAFSWRQESLAQDAAQLLQLSRDLYDRLGTVGGHLSAMGGSIRRSVETYNKLVGSLESRVLPSARRIAELDPTATDDDRLETSTVEATPRAITAPELLETAPGGGADPSQTDRGSERSDRPETTAGQGRPHRAGSPGGDARSS